MKNNIDFYQHYADADQHPKFKMLRVQFGWEGEGKFWALNNRIAQAEDCCLNISKKYNKSAIASDLDFSLPKFDEFISFLLIECELIKECSPGIITTDIIQENFDKVSVNREKARDRKQRYLEKVLKGSAEKEESSGELNKKVKVKESKGKEITSISGKIDSLKAYFLENIPKEFNGTKDKIVEFFQYRQQKPKSKRYQTEKAITGLFRDLSNCQSVGYPIDVCLDIAMERNWQTPSVDYFKPELFATRTDQQKSKPKTFAEREQEEKELFANRCDSHHRT